MIKQKLLNAISAHPKLAAFAIGLAITMAIGTAIGVVEAQQAYAVAFPMQQQAAYASNGGGCPGCA
jgi:hypothetical protein